MKEVPHSIPDLFSENAHELGRALFTSHSSYVKTLSSGPLKVVGSDTEGEIRVVELPDHPFFVGTLYVPQISSSRQLTWHRTTPLSGPARIGELPTPRSDCAGRVRCSGWFGGIIGRAAVRAHHAEE
jgi:hypothetical protein